ncbi:MAG: amidophosphoribosyltransferase [Candidatus Krumholzibacteriota bacterium]|nr:amidophosphoribosyltransferase [Candidatus Krumholzibacteriota bacterium]
MKEECAVFGIFGSEEAAQMTYLGLYSLQHRGQESSGIISYDGHKMHEHKAMGLVSKVFSDEIIDQLKGNMAIGHNRYSTTGISHVVNTQPFLVDCKIGKIAVAHNGNLVNAVELRTKMENDGSIFRSTMDSEVLLHLIARSREDTIEKMVIDALGQVRGAYSLLFLTQGKIIAARDPHGFRPLCLGKYGSTDLIASESCAFDILGAKYIREIEPGELIVLSEKGVESIRFAPASKKLSKCIFEFIYFSRPDSKVFGENVDKVRRKLGRKLAENHPADADIVISVPDSSNTIALGFAEASGLPYELGLIRNHYVGRTFIQPKQRERDWDVRIKFNPVRGVLSGRKVAVIDDSIVRGSTMRKLVSLIRQAGAAEVHLRIGSPPITHSCYYGIDTPTRSELIASKKSIDEIRSYLGVESLHYLSIKGLLECVDDPDNYCTTCFSGIYPVERSGNYSKDVFDQDNIESAGHQAERNSVK